MKLVELKLNEQTHDVAIVFSGGRTTMLAKALDVVRDSTGRIERVLIDRLIPDYERLEEVFYKAEGAFVSEVCRIGS
jgi:hypothetical protein